MVHHTFSQLSVRMIIETNGNKEEVAPQSLSMYQPQKWPWQKQKQKTSIRDVRSSLICHRSCLPSWRHGVNAPLDKNCINHSVIAFVKLKVAAGVGRLLRLSIHDWSWHYHVVRKKTRKHYFTCRPFFFSRVVDFDFWLQVSDCPTLPRSRQCFWCKYPSS